MKKKEKIAVICSVIEVWYNEQCTWPVRTIETYIVFDGLALHLHSRSI